MPKHHDTMTNEDINQKHGLNFFIASGVLLFSSFTKTATLFADTGLPVSVNSTAENLSNISELTSPALHPGIDVGHASGQFSSDSHKLTINQSTDKAILDWNSFNIAEGNSVQFIQPASTSVALNNIHQLNASQIFGHLDANGQVYLVNANGFVFGANAAVNTNSLVATNLNINDSVFQQGITKVVDSKASTNNSEPIAALSGDGSIYRNTGNGNLEKIRILVEKGATITANDQGRIILAAPEVENDGTITAPDGQVILVGATDKVYLQETNSANLRGLLVEVKTGGDVKNVGTILTDRGNTTLLGFAVSQEKIISASTSVALNGSVRLLAREGAKLVKSQTDQSYSLEPVSTLRGQDIGDNLGTQASVTLDTGSTTSVTLENSGGTAVDAQAQPKSTIDIESGIITLKDKAQIIAHSGTVNLTASETPSNPLTTTTSANKSQILLESGSKIDVSGIQEVALPMSKNIVNVELRDNELRDSPIQKTGILHAQTIAVDIRKNTPIANISGTVAAIQHSIDERSTKAGTVNLNSEGNIAVKQGATLDISGGSLHYLAGIINTTELVSYGKVYDISKADPNLQYQQILSNSQYQSDYYQGEAAGTINIKTQNLLLDGSIDATTTTGLLQRNANDLPNGGLLSINTSWSNQAQQNIIFQSSQTYTADQFNPTAASPLYLSNLLFNKGLKGLSINTGGIFSVAKYDQLNLPELSQFSVTAGEINLQGAINAPAGSISLKIQVGLDPTRILSGEINMATSSSIDTSGLWINDNYDLINSQALKTLPIDAGNINLQAQGDLILAQGSSINANGGAWSNSKNQITAGKGGNISLSSAGLIPSQLQFDGNLSSYSLAQGGALNITANDITLSDIVDNKSSNPNSLYLSTALLESGGFSQYSLTANAGNISLTANSHINLQETNWQLASQAMKTGSGTNLKLLTQAIILTDAFRHVVNLNLNLTHNASIAGGYVASRSINIDSNASINADPTATINLNSDANITIDGAINALAGQIKLNLSTPPLSIDQGYNPNQAIRLETNASLNVAGTTLLNPSSLGLTQGTVKNGGTVSLVANRGYILMDQHSSIDVSGTNQTLDIVNSRGISQQNIASSAGTINLTAAEGMVLEGQFFAQHGQGQSAAGNGYTTAGGSLNIELNTQHRGEPEAVTFTTSDRVINITTQPVNSLSSAQIASGIIPDTLNGLATISTQQIKLAGFDNLKLASSVIEPSSYSTSPIEPERGEILLTGDISLSLRQNIELDAPLINHNWENSNDTGQVNLNGNIITLGSSWNQTAHTILTNPALATHNKQNAALNLSANLINLRGASEINNFASTLLNSQGDIRLMGINPNGESNLLGSLNLTGQLNLKAHEIYPTTLSQFNLSIDSILSPNGSINILPANGTASTPLEAGGVINISAPSINSQGNLLAPFGSINLNALNNLILASGSITSVSDDSGTIIPFGRTQGGLDWIYPLGNYSNIQSGTPKKSISLNAPSINLQKNALVNLNGGGDLSTFEFIAGPGGSIDHLDPTSIGYQQNYAIVPRLSMSYSPYDGLEFPNSGLTLGENIHISANSIIPTGDYVLLPAHYALLPGAFLITPQTNTTDLASGTTISRIDGAQIVSGYIYTASTHIADSRWSGFAIEPGSIALTRSEYQQTTASQFFNTTTTTLSSLPQDAGNLSLLASKSLAINAEITAKSAIGGLGGLLDISADRLSIVNQTVKNNTPGTVTLLASDLNNLGVDSILLGGRRTRSSTGTQLNVRTQSIDIASNVTLKAPEIILTAIDSIHLESGGNITSEGSLQKSDTAFTITNNNSTTDGALLRVSNAGQATVLRDSSLLTDMSGNIEIDNNTQLNSTGSILLDSTNNAVFNGSINMTQGDLALNANLITLGDINTSNTGLHLSENTLNQLHVNNLSLSSANAINIAGDLQVQLKNLILDSPTLQGYGQLEQKTFINANTITLQNNHNQTSKAPANFGLGELQLKANTINLASGRYSLNGFKNIDLIATTELLNTGNNQITVNSDLIINTPTWTATSGANTQINLANYQLTTLAQGNVVNNTNLGAQLNITAHEIDHNGHIELASGIVTLNTKKALNLNTGSSIDASGRIVNLVSTQTISSAGAINLSATQGNIDIQKGANLNLSSTSKGSTAGNLALSTPSGTVTLAGDINDKSYNESNGGSFSLDSLIAVDHNFSTLNRLLQTSGFNNSISIRQRNDDLLITSTDHVKAENITLTTDSGTIEVQGKLDVSGTQAGSITLSANQGLLIDSSANLNASSSSQKGGKIILSSDPTNLSGIGLNVNKGAEIDVSGGQNNPGGSVEINVNRIGNNDAAVNIANDVIQGASSLIVEAIYHSVDTPLSNAQVQQWRDDTQNYMDNALQNDALKTRLAGFTLQPGLDIQSKGNLTLDLSESLKSNIWTSQDNTIWTTQLNDVAGLVTNLQQINSHGVIENLTLASSPLLNTDGTYYFDSNPNSATFRELFVRIFPNIVANDINAYQPNTLDNNLIEHDGWDFNFQTIDGQLWRFGNEQTPGLLEIRAAGDLIINQSITDGFALYDANQLDSLLHTTANYLPTQVLQTRQSWSYNLVAGADLKSANNLDVQTFSSIGSITVGTNTTIRTGTGNITLSSTNDIHLTDWTSTIYTAGHASKTQRYGSFTNTAIVNTFFAEYPTEGGNISLNAGGNIIGASTPQLMSDWLQRTGNWNSNSISRLNRPTAWGIAFDGLVIQDSTNAQIQNLKFGFRENIGALGGGDISINAGANIKDLSVMLPSSAKPIGKMVGGIFQSNTWQEQGGGNLTVNAGGNIEGGVFYVDKGTANINSLGSITGGSQYTSGPIFALGDAQFQITANNAISVGTVFNPFSLTPAKFLDKTDYFTTYTANSSINFLSRAGSITLNNDTHIIQQQYKIFDQNTPLGGNILTSDSLSLLTLYPGSLTAIAINGALNIENSMTLYPAAGSSVYLITAGDINLGNLTNGFTLNQLDVDPTTFLSVLSPTTTVTGATQYLYTTPYGGKTSTVHAAQAIHQNDTTSNIISSAYGSITGLGYALVAAAKFTNVWAGADIINLGMMIQNITQSDNTTIYAGQDILFPIQRDTYTGEVQGSAGGIQLAGPGTLNVSAGRNIDLGSSEGITTVGALLNPSLANIGANIIVLAGNPLIKNPQSIDDFITYYANKGLYLNTLSTIPVQATALQRLQIALVILFDEIKSVGKNAATFQGIAQKLAYQQGYDAIKRLFPKSQTGDIKLFFSQIQSLEGGNIDLLSPKGSINAGLASAFTGQKSASELGIIAQHQGDINILVNKDLEVNQSRVFTLQSGNITVWASEGNIDAGRGAKSATSTQQPISIIDANGNLKVEFPASVSGSGIRAQSGYYDNQIGDVTLVAPKGVINTGEAGIGGKNITIAATAIIGASNIQALGNTLGIPKLSTPTPSIPTINNALVAITQTPNGLSLDDEDNFNSKSKKAKPKISILNTELVGFGNYSVADIRANKP